LPPKTPKKDLLQIVFQRRVFKQIHGRIFVTATKMEEYDGGTYYKQDAFAIWQKASGAFEAKIWPFKARSGEADCWKPKKTSSHAGKKQIIVKRG
jgi:hypothetical protein